MNSETYEGFHRSHDPSLVEVSSGGLFGGLFAGPRAGMSGAHVYAVYSPAHLTDFQLNYEIEGAWEKAVEICDGDESLAEVIMTPGCETEDGEDGWNAQRLRGKLAAALGFTSVEMEDETGSCALCLPGCSIRLATADEAASAERL